MRARCSLLWFRQDLRLADNPALAAAAARGEPVVPVYVHDPDAEMGWSPGDVSRAWLAESLASLDADLRVRGSRLILARGSSRDIIRKIARQSRADFLFFDRRYDEAGEILEREVAEALRLDGRTVMDGNASLCAVPEAIVNSAGEPYRVFTPFHRAWLRATCDPPPPRAAPGSIPAPPRWPRSAALAGCLDVPAGAAGCLRGGGWKPGETGARERLRSIAASLAAYPGGRDLPAEDLTSRLSPHLHFGEIDPWQVIRAVEAAVARRSLPGMVRGAEALIRQLAWREFAVHLLHRYPETAEKPLRVEFASFPWSRSRVRLDAWEQGRTGFPIVDAGMRQLLSTGWMHNRVRMIVASFLTKDLRLSWLEGARWFWERLVDADLANNTFGWQWTAGCGADAAPYFRVFNPTLQGMKFDPRGIYVRRFIPELARLPDRWIHRPVEAPPAVLRAAGLRLGRDYPKPIVDHAEAREGALRAFASIRGRGRS